MWFRPIIPATWKAEAGRSQVKDQSRPLSEFRVSLGNLVKPYINCLKIKSKMMAGTIA